MSKSQAGPSRRGFVWGAAAAGAATAAAVMAPKAPPEGAQTPPTEAPPAPERGGGYRLSEHVQRYYRTTRL